MTDIREKMLCGWILVLIAAAMYVMVGKKNVGSEYYKSCRECTLPGTPKCTPAETAAACSPSGKK